MEYISTRNRQKIFSFKDVFLNGLASDGGLYIPKKIPSYSLKELESLKELSYEQLAVKVILNFCSDEFNETEIKDLVNKSSQPSFYTLRLYYGLASISFFSFSEGNISSLDIPSARIIELATKIEE